MMQARPLRVLTVCIGNVCRSPLMERLLRARMSEGTTVTSAGVRAMAGHPMEPHALKELHRLGGDADDFAARQVTATLTQDADLILTATAEVRSRLLQEAPGALRRAFTLREFAFLVERSPGAARKRPPARPGSGRTGRGGGGRSPAVRPRRLPAPAPATPARPLRQAW